MKSLQAELRRRIGEKAGGEFPIEPDAIDFNIPPERRFGDLSCTLPFQLAKRTGQKPFLVGRRLVELLSGHLPGVTRLEIAGGGFLNFFLDRDQLFSRLREGLRPEKTAEKVVVEHTSINPNKAAHIGHLRNSCLGDTLARGFRFLGCDVEVQNYIDDTGIQMADVVFGLLRHEGKTPQEISAIPDLARYLWRLYPEVSQRFADDEELARQRNEVHKRIEEKREPEYSVCRHVATVVLRDHIRVMGSLGIRYDLLVHESDVIGRGLFEELADRLVDQEILYPSRDPGKSGCRVIFYDREKLEKIVLRSNGTLTYIGKDLAYNFWKFGLLGSDFLYERFFAYEDGREIWSTGSEAGNRPPRPFARAGRVYNVIDVRQSYLQSIINQVLSQLGFEAESRNFIHYAYEMVALTPASVRELGMELEPGEERKPYVVMSGRKGRAVSADELIDQLSSRSLAEVQSRHPAIDAAQASLLARDIAVGALRYYMIKHHLNTIIAFDFREALNFEGDTGPYLQYTMVRLNSILSRLPGGAPTAPAPLSRLGEKEAALYWEIVLNLSLLELQVRHALENLDLSSLAAYACGLCQKMNQYYHLYPVIAEADPQLQGLRLHLIYGFKERMGLLLDIMGIPIPEKM